MNATTLRWSSIDGKSWRASDSAHLYEIELLEGKHGRFDTYRVVVSDIENPDLIGDASRVDYVDTIQEAKAFCKGFRK